MNRLFTALTLVSALALTACGPDQVPQDIVDTNMTITRINAQKNANAYLPVLYPQGTTDVKLGDPIRILMQSDSTVSKTCRYGDGWASGEIAFDSGKSMKVKCQTNGAGKGINGCMTQAEFDTKTYKEEDGKCQNLTKLEKM